MLFFAQDLIYFYGTIYGGLLIGLIFDINRALKFNFKIIEKCYIVFDILFWILATIIMFITINAMEFFELRYYHFIALLIGFILYYTIISKFVLLLLNISISFIKTTISFITKYIMLIMESLYYIVIYTTHLLIDIFYYILSTIFNKKKVIRRKPRN